MSNHNTITALLKSLSFALDDQGHCHRADAALEPADNLIAPLSHYGFLVTQGPDSAKFLQGQTTCNLNAVTRDQSLPGAYCTPKGRVVSSFRIGCAEIDSGDIDSGENAASDNNAFLMRMRSSLVGPTMERLAKYIVFSKAEQRDASEEYLAIGLSGARAATTIEQTFGVCPDKQNQQQIAKGNLLIQIDEPGQLFECWIKREQIPRLWPLLSEGLTVQGSRTWELLTIRQGQGEICPATADMFIPQMLNYQVTGAISFTKGCYTGQEVVARMQYKGKTKRQLYRVIIAAEDIEPATVLYRPGATQSIGEVVNVISLGNGQSEALAVITIQDAEAGLVAAGENHAPVEVLSLPYAITN